MQSEVAPIVVDFFESERLAGRAKGTTEVLKRASIKVDNVEEKFNWSWPRPGLSPNAAVTIWAEGILPVDAQRWLSVERIDVNDRAGGAAWSEKEKPRAMRRFAILRKAYQSGKPLMGFPQINRRSIKEILNNEVANVSLRVKDDVPWHVVEVNDEKHLAVMVRGAAPWQPTPQQIAAAEARWTVRTPDPIPVPLPSLPAALPDLATAPVLFVNIAWMRKYAGSSLEDPVGGGNFGFFKREGNNPDDAHEQFNFHPYEGRMYGYVPRSSNINILKLGAGPKDDVVEGVLVAFMARDPAENLLKVVGWYEGATVHRAEVDTLDRKGMDIATGINAPAEHAVVLPVADRTLIVPTAQREAGGVGQSPLWYGEQHPDVVQALRDLVRLYRMPSAPVPPATPPGGSGSPRNLDPATRLLVEKAAMEMAMAYFDNTVDVSKLCKGWDIEGTCSRGTLFIEVKGLSGPGIAIELTPNEYEKMRLNKERYVVFVVTRALTHSRQGRSFRYIKDDGSEHGLWQTAQGETLSLEPRTGARGSCANALAADSAA